MRYFWICCLLVSIWGAVCSGKTAALSAAVLESASSGVRLAISLAGPLCLWSGVSNIIQHSTLQEKLTNVLSPFLRYLFPSAWNNPAAKAALCGNITANLLGLGNAATPYGVRAVNIMSRRTNGRATDELCRFVVINTASIQLFPATIAAVRSSLGAAKPLDILPAVWITSMCALTAGLLAAKGLSKWSA